MSLLAKLRASASASAAASVASVADDGPTKNKKGKGGVDPSFSLMEDEVCASSSIGVWDAAPFTHPGPLAVGPCGILVYIPPAVPQCEILYSSYKIRNLRIGCFAKLDPF